MSRLAIFLLVTSFSIRASGAEPPGAGWARVEQLRSGQAVRVLSSGQRTWTGRLARVSADGLVVDVDGAGRETARSEVLRVQVKSRTKSILIGLGIGAGIGAGVGYAAGSGLKDDEKATAAGLGALLVAPAGALIGALAPGWKTIYVNGAVASSRPGEGASK